MNAGAAPDLLRPLGQDLARVLVPYLAARARTLGRTMRTAEETELESARLGLGLGLVAAACGIEVLRGRRERCALPRLLELLAHAVGETPDERWHELPDLSGRAGAGWEAPVLVGWAWLAARRAGTAREWSQECRGETWWFRVPQARRPASRPVAAATPWCWREDGARLGLGLPRAWVVPR